MAEQVILDTGPLVAYLDKREQHHAWAVREFSRLSDTLLTCEAVITEACFLLADLPRAQQGIGELMERDIIACRFDLHEERSRVFSLMRKYADQPMSLADACLVCMTEDHPSTQVFTLDSDFAIYRLRNGRAVPRISPYR
jgi:uncharacterized protein